MNEAAMAIDEQVIVEMQRLQTEASLELCYVLLHKVDPGKIKIAFNNARSLRKHFKDVEFEPNVLAADVIGFAESKLCKRDDNVPFAFNRFRLIRLDDTEKESVITPHHGLAMYIKEYFQLQKVFKLLCQSFELAFAAMHSIRKGYFQVVILYKYTESSQTDFKNDLCCYLMPVVDLNAKLVILGDFNIQINCANSGFVEFMDIEFSCVQQIKEPTTDSGSILDLIFVNCQVVHDVLEAYWTDHKLIYCVTET